jgi:hypothetical protein
MSDRAEPSGLSEERLEILRLVENQIITADEASRLLEALDRSDRADATATMQPTEPLGFFPPGFPFAPEAPRRSRGRRRNVRIRITNAENNIEQFNLVLPHSLLDTGLKMAKRFAPDQLLDAREIKESIDDGFEGALLDIVDGDQRVEIIVEDQGTRMSGREQR